MILTQSVSNARKIKDYFPSFPYYFSPAKTNKQQTAADGSLVKHSPVADVWITCLTASRRTTGLILEGGFRA